MDIGKKLQAARIKAKMTQEDAASALGVSRQTISNWENEKTYPDIISVIKMSDVYKISLDLLLKEEQPMTGYIDYLKESTDVVSSNEKKGKIILVSAYLIIWTLSLIVFWLMNGSNDAMGYGIAVLWIIIPVITFIVSVLIGKNNYWQKKKWWFALFAGVMYCLAEYGSFSAANMVTFGKVNLPEFTMILVGAIISAIGLWIGQIIYRKKKQ